jgi:trafficking protein particle complex subunit 10
LIPYFSESWVYSTCVNIIQHCEDLVAASSDPNTTQGYYEGIKAELLHMARLQLDMLGVASGLFSSSIHVEKEFALPGANSLSPPGSAQRSETDPDMLRQLTNLELVDALASPSGYDALYIVSSMRY